MVYGTDYGRGYFSSANAMILLEYILCKKKHDALVKITLPREANIFASEYKLYLPSKEDLRQRLMEWTRDMPAHSEDE